MGDTMETKQLRQPRAAGSRVLEGRTSERPPINYFKNSLFTFPPTLVEAYPHKVFGWIRYAYGDSQEDVANYEKCVNDFWDPVPSSLCPELASRAALSPFERQKPADELIRRKGHVLMWCDRDVYEERESRYDEMNARTSKMASMCLDSNLKSIVDERHIEYR